VQEAAGRCVVLPAFTGGFQQSEGAVYVGFDKGFQAEDGAKEIKRHKEVAEARLAFVQFLLQANLYKGLIWHITGIGCGLD